MSQPSLATRFAALHVKGRPVVLFNAWDAGSAKAIAAAGAPAIATSSWAVAAAHGYEDGEAIPFAFVEALVARVVASVPLPVTADVEGGYSDDPATCAANVARLVDRGVVLGDPAGVRPGRLAAADDPDRTGCCVFAHPVNRTSANGVTGFPSRATADKGREAFGWMVEDLSALIRKGLLQEPPLPHSYFEPCWRGSEPPATSPQR